MTRHDRRFASIASQFRIVAEKCTLRDSDPAALLAHLRGLASQAGEQLLAAATDDHLDASESPFWARVGRRRLSARRYRGLEHPRCIWATWTPPSPDPELRRIFGDGDHDDAYLARAAHDFQRLGDRRVTANAPNATLEEFIARHVFYEHVVATARAQKRRTGCSYRLTYWRGLVIDGEPFEFVSDCPAVASEDLVHSFILPVAMELALECERLSSIANVDSAYVVPVAAAPKLVDDQVLATGRTLVEFRKSGPGWTIMVGTRSRDFAWSRGIAYLHELLSKPATRIPAAELDGIARRKPTVDSDLDDTRLPPKRSRARPPMNVADGLEPLRRRCAELARELEDAIALQEEDEAARLKDEMEQVQHEIDRQGGRQPRRERESEDQKRVRQRVGRAIGHAIESIESAFPEVGNHLAIHVKEPAGYAPWYESDAEFAWMLC